MKLKEKLMEILETLDSDELIMLHNKISDCDDYIYSMGEFDKIMYGQTAEWIACRVFNGEDGYNKEGCFNPSRDYFTFNGYGNLVSFDYASDYIDLDEIADYITEKEDCFGIGELEEVFEEYEEEKAEIEELEELQAEYIEYKEEKQAKINALPLKFAFSNEQFENILNEWNCQPCDLVSIGYNGYCLKKDKEEVKKVLLSPPIDLLEKCGEEFIKGAFLYELFYHEYAYNCYQGDWDTIDSIYPVEWLGDSANYCDYFKELEKCGAIKDAESHINIYKEMVDGYYKICEFKNYF